MRQQPVERLRHQLQASICRVVAVNRLAFMNRLPEPAALTSGLSAVSSAWRASFWSVRSWPVKTLTGKLIDILDQGVKSGRLLTKLIGLPPVTALISGSIDCHPLLPGSPSQWPFLSGRRVLGDWGPTLAFSSHSPSGRTAPTEPGGCLPPAPSACVAGTGISDFCVSVGGCSSTRGTASGSARNTVGGFKISGEMSGAIDTTGSYRSAFGLGCRAASPGEAIISCPAELRWAIRFRLPSYQELPLSPTRPSRIERLS